ncbi:DUF1801 domain-containing protein [Oricola sp.]|uniref:DUF1801 domain-containing protein n=1 Tax=Oricola sp. TaxID=1979950 RepID=UPI003BACD1C5
MNRNRQVEDWLASYENPMKDVVAAMRDAILAADPRVSETIKWRAPTFVYKGNIASFFPRSKKHASLMFHRGAHIPGDFPNLEGDAKDGRSFKIAKLAELETKKDELQAVVIAWCDMMDGG